MKQASAWADRSIPRAIWEFTGELDLSGYCEPVKAIQGVAGREPWDVRLLMSLWIYAYSRAIGSAREIARRCEYDPAFQWLTGLEKINYHTLADFRVAHLKAAREQVAAMGDPRQEAAVRQRGARECAGITYNIQQWIRLRWRIRPGAPA